eukprot:355184_1
MQGKIIFEGREKDKINEVLSTFCCYNTAKGKGIMTYHYIDKDVKGKCVELRLHDNGGDYNDESTYCIEGLFSIPTPILQASKLDSIAHGNLFKRRFLVEEIQDVFFWCSGINGRKLAKLKWYNAEERITDNDRCTLMWFKLDDVISHCSDHLFENEIVPKLKQYNNFNQWLHIDAKIEMWTQKKK